MAKKQPLLPAALIYNPGARAAHSQDDLLEQVRALLKDANIAASVYKAQDDEELTQATKRGVQEGAEMIIACGGDGTLESVANQLVDSQVTLGILPAGTRNNVAAGLQIPVEMDQAVALLRSGQRLAIDIVDARCGDQQRWFLEIFTAGLLSKVFEDADAAQKGNLGALGDLLTNFVVSAPADLELTVENGQQNQTIALKAYAVMGLNMPYVGANFRVADDIDYRDGLLDIFLYDGLSKLDLLVEGFTVAREGATDSRVQRLRAQRLTLHSDPPLPILVDGVRLGEGPVTLQMHQQALYVMAGPLSVT